MPKMTILALFGPNINFIKKGPTNCAISQKREFLSKKNEKKKKKNLKKKNFEKKILKKNIFEKKNF